MCNKSNVRSIKFGTLKYYHGRNVLEFKTLGGGGVVYIFRRYSYTNEV